MDNQIFNPYLPSWEYIADTEPYIVGNRLYIYGSHDKFGGINACLGDFVCWSTPLDDLGSWTNHGVIYERKQDPSASRIQQLRGLSSPDLVVGQDGRYYLYYSMLGNGMISVAVSDKPFGKFEYLGFVKYKDGTPIGKRHEPLQTDPACLMDDDGRLYLYTGYAFNGNPLVMNGAKPTAKGPMWFEIDTKDMLTVISGDDLHYLGAMTGEQAKGTDFEEQPFGAASSMRKFDGKYYFIYASMNAHTLCYALSDKPTGGFQYGGTLVSCGDIGMPGITDVKHARNCTGNIHGSLIELNGKMYVFYHRHTNRKQTSRQACAEEIRVEDGKLIQAEMTSCGLNNGTLAGIGHYPAYIACNVYGKDGTYALSMIKHMKGTDPYLTQQGGDREEGEDQYIANFSTGCTVGFKYFDLTQTRSVIIRLRGRAIDPECKVSVRTEEQGAALAKVSVTDCKEPQEFTIPLPEGLGDREALYFSAEGKCSFDFISFDLSDIAPIVEPEVDASSEEESADSMEEEIIDAAEAITVVSEGEEISDSSMETIAESTEENLTDSAEKVTAESAEEGGPDSAEEATAESAEEEGTDSAEETTLGSVEEESADSAEETQNESAQEVTSESMEGKSTDSTEETPAESDEKENGESNEEAATESVEEEKADSAEKVAAESEEKTPCESVVETRDRSEHIGKQ